MGEKGHGRFSSWRVTRVAVTPEEIGLCGCWQVIAVERWQKGQHAPDDAATREIGYYATSLAVQEYDEAALLAFIRGHWSAIENGTHYQRDVTLGEDACCVADRNGVAVLASPRSLANGLYELQKARARTTSDSLRACAQPQTFTTAWPLLTR